MLHGRGDEQINHGGRHHNETDPPVKNQDHHRKDQSVEHPAQHGHQYHRSHRLHIVQHGGADPGELSQAVVVEVAHGDGFHPLPDGHALIGRHEVPGVGLLELREILGHGAAQNTDCQQTQRLPRRGRAGFSIQQSQDGVVDGGDLKHMEHRVEKAGDHRAPDVALFLTGKPPDASECLNHTVSPSFTPM